MDIIFEFIFEVILEGSFELIKNKNVPILLRLFLGLLLFVIYGGLFTFIIYLTFDVFIRNDLLMASILFIIDILFIMGIIHLFKKYKNE